MFPSIFSFLKLGAAYLRLNLLSQLEYRGAFISQAAAMFINDCIWIVFWCMFFHRFPILRGWTLNDFITLWALAATGWGFAATVFGNASQLAGIIARGQLDAWMLYPRALLPHLLLGRTSATAFGDVLFGFAVYLVMVRPDPVHFLLFFVLSLSTAAVFLGFNIFTGSFSFYLGNAEGLAEQWRFAMLSFSTYPASLFDGAVKILLYTLIPAGFINYLPVEALRRLSLTDAALAVLGGAAVLLASIVVFYHGLRRYESGNLIDMKG